MANETKGFVEELRTAFNGIAELISNRINDIDKDIDENIQTIQSAYDSIKADKAEIKEITDTVFEFSAKVMSIADDGVLTNDDCEKFIADCTDLVRDGYIEDEDYEKIEDEEYVDNDENDPDCCDEKR